MPFATITIKTASQHFTMAIIKHLGLQVRIHISGSPAVEYVDSDPEADPKFISPNQDVFTAATSHCYVESVEDTEFSIEFSVVTPEPPAKIWACNEKQLYVFVVDIGGHNGTRRHSIGPPKLTYMSEGIVDYAQGTIRKYRFARLSTHDDSCTQVDLEKDIKIANDTGRIRVAVYRYMVLGEKVRVSRSHHPEPGQTESKALAEKALKGRAIHHTATLSAASPYIRPRQPSRMELVGEYIDKTSSPFAVFYFKYRSRKALEEEMIIPRNVSEIDHGADDKKVKREINKKENDGRNPKRLRLKTENESGQEAIDLTQREDDDQFDDYDVGPKAKRPRVKMEGKPNAIDLTQWGDDDHSHDHDKEPELVDLTELD